eukprot:1347866-Amorphochlora_amoeboformis.AAC.1
MSQYSDDLPMLLLYVTVSCHFCYTIRKGSPSLDPVTVSPYPTGGEETAGAAEGIVGYLKR